MADQTPGQTPPEQPTQPQGSQPPTGEPPPGWQPQAPAPDPYGLGPTSMGMSAHVAAAISYVLTWITGLIFFFTEKQNKFVRFHAMQAILVGVLGVVLVVVFNILLIPMVFTGLWICGSLIWLLWLAYLVLIIYCIIQAATGKWFKLPVIGDIAAKQAGV